ncbi:FecR family protein [Prolixibacteraceae bacterium Z1-6]|uniref:FecR family protein n=1 Tax=Draconibacterium aestuarii TaxID=2998507 RepID=A0A9X3J510_9BACT|nr:FecR family protein [Prolixibacteraceae bacterium Z1-6]
MEKKYIHTDDFLFCENFNEYVRENSPKQQKMWDGYFEQFPEVKYSAEIARTIIEGLVSMEDKTSVKEIPDSRLHNQFEETWDKFKGEKSKKVRIQVSKVMWRSIAVAAVLVFALLMYPVLNQLTNRNVTPEYFEVYVPTAKQSQITLPDGTKVWVNSETKIKYSNQFNTKERTIYLAGEAFFDVAKNKELPLQVIANDARIKVTGTQFNVKGYPDEDKVETVLVEGRVELSRVGDMSGRSIALQPGDKAILNLGTNKVGISREDVLDDVAWKDGKTMYRNVVLKDVCKSLSRKYDAEIVLSGDTENLLMHPFTFTIVNETLPLVLDYLCKAAPLMYNVEYIDEDGEKGIEKIKYTISAR